MRHGPEMTLWLGELANPLAFTEPVDASPLGSDLGLEFLERMIVIRRVEQAVAQMVESGEAKCPCHLAIGQEAIAVGVAAHLNPSDRVFGAHRSHSIFLALGGKPERLFGEILGKDSGSSRGMGGSMHLFEPTIGLLGTVPIVAATVPIAAGAALAAKMDGGNNIAATFFGDGATEEGVFHETLNMAAVKKLPLLFVCENNLFSSHLHISLRQPFDSVLRFATANGVPGKLLDGNNVVTVWKAAGELIASARKGGGPAMLEAVTYRWLGHVGHRDDIDVGVRRKDELGLWKKRDPIERLARAIVASGSHSESDLKELDASVVSAVADALDRARKADYPPTSLLLDAVYSRRRDGRID
jgi:TPP-dependent pyruvate/acetoin dehydrogenase alpha subunit